MPRDRTDRVIYSPKGNRLPFLDISWSGRIGQRLIAATLRMQKLDILLRTIGRKVVLGVRRNFTDGRTPEGQRWPGLKKPRSAGRNPGSHPLLDTYRGYGSITFVVGDDYVSIGYPGETSYLRFHQHGTRWIPQRRFLGLREGDVPDMRAAMREHLERALAA